ncbi:MotA/TolQ/ExbB proton channel family protein [Nioella ostreopsis]|uniref:MotA/TolQ/ExbB proton channel family protein n=1 Tax=Nioella ostreopsis TaxID=2448479 RepID=UPI00197DCF4F|nr:MotA/TolQ/ExbB proton channel family protein [Nioella ostreopsis]
MKNRLAVAAASLALGAVFIAALSFALPPHTTMGSVLLDRDTRMFTYPFTIQNVMWLCFFVALGELWLRRSDARREHAQLRQGLLPEDEETLLQPQDLAPIMVNLKQNADTVHSYLPRLLKRVILQFQASRSIDQANSLMNTSLELYQHEIDLKYNMLRYITWLIPTLGFIGTVVGIAAALSSAGTFPGIENPALIPPWMRLLTSDLGVAFYTTLLALVQSAVLVFVLHIMQEREEMALNLVGQYCMDNLISRLYLK